MLIINPTIKEKRGKEELSCYKIETSSDGRLLYRFLDLEMDMPDYVFCGGLYYFNRNFRKYCVCNSCDYKTISLYDSYTYMRVFPQEIDGKVYISSYYVNLPVFFLQKDKFTFGFKFNPFIEKNNLLFPFFFYFSFQNEKFLFSVVLISSFEVFVKKENSFKNWQQGGWCLPDKKHFQLTKDAIFRIDIFNENFSNTVRGVIAEALDKRKQNIDIEYHLQKSRRHLLSVWEDTNGIFASNNLRFTKRMFGFSAVPLFDSLLVDTYALAKMLKDTGLEKISERYKQFLLNEQISVLLPKGGRVWHNHVIFDGEFHIYSNYNTGIGGFPGGQATVIWSLFKRHLCGDKDNILLNYAIQGADWLNQVIFADGHWARSYKIDGLKYICPDSDTVKESLSIGGNAEGSMALFLAYKVTNNNLYLKTAKMALEFVNKFLTPGPIAFGYLRDNTMKETDGISSVFAILANIEALEIYQDKVYLTYATCWGYYLLTWIRLWQIDNFSVDWSMDPLISSFKPRISSYETSLCARACLELFQYTHDEFWLLVAERVFFSINIENEYRGYSEGLYLTLDKNIKPLYFESSYATSAVLGFLLRYCEIKNITQMCIPQEKIASIIVLRKTNLMRLRGVVKKIIKTINRRIF